MSEVRGRPFYIIKKNTVIYINFLLDFDPQDPKFRPNFIVKDTYDIEVND